MGRINMQIKTSEIINEIQNLKNIIDKYENIKNNLFNQLEKCSDFWNDGKSVLFFDSLKYERVHVDETIKEMKKVHDVYIYLYEKYIEMASYKVVESTSDKISYLVKSRYGELGCSTSCKYEYKEHKFTLVNEDNKWKVSEFDMPY